MAAASPVPRARPAAGFRNVRPAYNAAEDPTEGAEFTRSLAVVIGVAAYGNGVVPLETPTRDAEALALLLEKFYGYEVWLRTDEAATREHLRRLLHEELPAAGLEETSRLLFFFAGHGFASNSDTEGPEGFVLPQDAGRSASTFLRMAELREAFDRLSCRHLLAILDCCFAGAFRWSATRRVVSSAAVLYEERYRHFVRRPAWQVITSAAHNQEALDVPAGLPIGVREESGFHSPFARALLDGLGGAADLVPDGVITASELYTYLQLTVRPPQTPRSWPLPRDEQGEFVFCDPGRPLELPSAAEAIVLENPYRGLEPYERHHGHLFFGRASETERLAAQVEAMPLTVVVGPSGSGKSSLVRAGLAPRLETAGWTVALPLRPGADPLASLAGALRLETEVSSAAELRRDPEAVRRTVARWLAAPGRRLVLVVDQFEELVTEVRSPADATLFQRCLAAILGTADGGRIRLVVTVRSDFEPAFSRGPLRPYWRSDARFVPRPMTREELREIVVEPAESKVLFFESLELVDRLVDEVAQTPGVLPLLSFALSEIYRLYVESEREDRTLAAADLDRLGGVSGALRARAEEEYAALPDDAHRAMLRRVLLRMVAPGPEPTRHRVSKEELEYPDEAENGRRKTICDRLVAARLLVADSDFKEGSAGEPPRTVEVYEPVHDALINGWDRLRRWLVDERDELPLQRRVAQASEDWTARGRDRKLLWTRDPRLFQLRDAIGYAKQWLNRRELEFFAASWRARRQRLGSLWGGVAAALAISSAVAVFFYLQNQENIRLRIVSIGRGLANRAQAESAGRDHHRALLLASQAFALVRDRSGESLPLVDRALRDAVGLSMPGVMLLRDDRHSPGPVRFSPAQDLLAVGLGPDVLVMDLLSGRTILRFRGAKNISALAWSGDGRLLASLRSRELCVVRLSDRRSACREVIGSGSTSDVLAFAGSSPQLVAMYSDVEKSQIEIFRIGSDGPVPSIEEEGGWTVPGILFDLAIDPAGTFIVAVAPGRLHRWSLDGGGADWEFLHHQGFRFYTVAFSPDGSVLAAGSTEGRIALWHADRLIEPPSILQAGAAIEDLAFHPGIHALVAAGRDGTCSWWSLETPERLVRVFSAYVDRATDVTFDRTGSRLAAAGFSRDGHGAVRLWHRGGTDWHPNDSASRRPLRLRAGVSSLTYDPVKRAQLVIGFANGRLELWDAARRRLVHELKGHSDSVESVAFFDDGRRVISAAGDNTILVHDLSGPRLVSRQLPVRGRVVAVAARGPWIAALDKQDQDRDVIRLFDPSTPQRQFELAIDERPWILAIALHPDGDLLAAGGDHLRLWRRMREGHRLVWRPEDISGPESFVLSLAFSPDGRWLAAGGAIGNRGVVWLRDLAVPDAAPVLLEGLGQQVPRVEFDGDSSLLAAAAVDGNVYLWRLASPGAPPIVLDGHDGQVVALAFAPTGSELASGDLDGLANLWTLDTDALVRSACDLASANLQWSEWTQLVGADLPYERTCDRPVHPSVLEAGDALARAGEVERAEEIFSRVAELEPSTATTLRARAAALERLGRARRLAGERQVSRAAALVRQVESSEHRALIDVDDWGELCKQSLRHGLGVLQACEKAADLAPDDLILRRNRAFARALAGRLGGASQDLQFYVEGSVLGPDAERWEGWITDLMGGRNPFTAQQVARLVLDERGGGEPPAPEGIELFGERWYI